MPEFNPLQEQIQQVRSNIETQNKTIFRSKERLKKLELEKQRVRRSAGENSDEFQGLLEQERNLKQEISGRESQLAGFLQTEASVLEAFLPFTDPRENLGQLSDDYPVLLFPVRLETRFKKTGEDSGETQHQLWVRIFPDECSIDTFDDTLSESELKKAKNYWTSIWKAGTAGNDGVKPFIKDKGKGAWRKLMGLFNAGRAYWITQNFHPLNEDEIPERNNESDILLIIPTEEVPDPATQNALRDYWTAVLLAHGDAGKIQAALEALTDAIGGSGEEAIRLTEQYVPQNIELEQPDEETPPDVAVAFLQFPASEDVDTKLNAWSRAAKVTTLPEKFVLLGFQEGNSEPVISELGNTVPNPLIVGPDTRDDINEVLRAAYGDEFQELSNDEKAAKYVEYLSEQADTKWLFNFEEAVKMGLGFKVNLSEQMYNQGFERLFVLGVKMAAGEQQGKTELEQLIRNHHFGDSGFAILPQGTPTNNTEDDGAGYSVTEDAGEAYTRYHPDKDEDDPSDKTQKRDGRWLAELLGIDPDSSSLHLVENYFQKDQSEARAMNTALWNATIGYFMESMVTPVSSEWERDNIREFLINHVSGRGKIPAIRIGDQPYGILPAGAITDLKWLTRPRIPFAKAYSNQVPVLEKIYSVLLKVKDDWEELIAQVAHIGKEGDAHKILLDALGLHATSVEFDRRIAESFQSIINKLKLQGILGDEIDNMGDTYKARGMQLLQDLGYEHDEKLDPVIPILEKFFLTSQEDVTKSLIDDNPLSEKDPIRTYTDADQNYIEWLIENAQNDHRNIRDQEGFTDNIKPDALLYEMLRHALNLEFGNTGLNYYKSADILDADDAAFARIDANFIDIQPDKTELESKWDLVYRKEAVIAGETLMVDFISDLLKNNTITPESGHLHEVIAALEYLKDAPTARLERCFVEHLDCCTYRLDAWLLGFLHLQLQAMRSGRASFNEKGINQGIYLGAYGFVEDLKPEDKILTPAQLDPELEEIFDPAGENDIMEDDTNAGYVHAPSVNHGLTAAVLRNAYISNASEEEKEIFKVNLSSERVRMALAVIEGMQQGQSLGALLGYQLERGLHDHTDEELDIYIYELRKVFPLVSNRMKPTKISEDKTADSPEEAQRFQEEEEAFEEEKAITKIEARNVVDGLSLLEHIKETGSENYPFGFPTGVGADKLKAATTAQQNAIDKEVQRLMNIRDAVADVAMTESVHQVVQGNYDRAAGALDAYSKGNYPQTPDVIQSPGSGISLTHRFGIHLPSGIAPASGTKPRSTAEPAVNAWLEDIFPALSDIYCVISYEIPTYEEGSGNAPVEENISMAQLGLLPIDLLYMLSVESEKSLSSLDACILKYVHQNFTPRPDATIEIKYTQAVEGSFTFFELAPMISGLRSLILASRPLLPTDIQLQNEAKEEQNAASAIHPDRILLVKQSLEDILSDLNDDFLSVLDPLIDPESLERTMSNKTQIIHQFDVLSGHFINYFSQLGQFGIPQAGFGYVYGHKSEIYAAAYKKVLDYKKRWDGKITEYNDLVNNQFPAAVTDEEKIGILQKAERIISTQYTVTFTSVSDLFSKVTGKKPAFDTKYAAFETFLTSSHLNILDLFNAVGGLKTDLELFDLVPLETEEDGKQVVILAVDMKKQADQLYASVSVKLTAVQELLDEEAATAVVDEKIQALTDAAKLIFGDDFVMLPEFNLSGKHGAELQNCLDDQAQLLDFQVNDRLNDFPVDEWLYGIARVREKAGAWENLVMLAEAFKDRPPLTLTPVQLPYTENDSWLGLEYPDEHEIESDKLLYTAYMPGFDPALPQCGLLADEWTEVIPAKKETTGMAFHYDRPNCEPPQTMLLATPSAFTGQWEWEDLVKSLHETLDMAKLRAVEPDHIDQTPYAQFLPATVAAVTTHLVTMMLNYAFQPTQIISDDNG